MIRSFKSGNRRLQSAPARAGRGDIIAFDSLMYSTYLVTVLRNNLVDDMVINHYH